MKKPLIALSFAVASALALADSVQHNPNPWFVGIGGETETTIAGLAGLKTTNGSWTIPDEAASFENASLVLDLGSNEEAKFEVGATDPGEAGAAQALTVTGIFNPIAPDDLLTGAQMAAAEAQVGFAVVGVESEGAMTYKYYAWVGGSSEAAAENPNPIADWLELGVAKNVEEAKTITIGLSYWTDDVTATFALGADPATATALKSNVLLSGAALAKAKANKKIASVSCTGSGTLNALSGAYQYAVAEADGKKFPTVEAAVESGASEVKLLKAAVGGVTVSGCCVTIDPNGNTSPNVVVNDNSKEKTVSDSGLVTVQTTKTILEGVKVGTAQNGLMVNEAGFRAFLNKHCKDAYTKANTDATSIKTALDAQNETSGRTLWQSYALGVEPEAAVTPKQVAQDKDENNITLALPVKPTGDFGVTCTVGTEEPQTLTAESSTFKVPMATGHYPVKITFN